jgi:CheY-like chemotaxis protein
MKKILVADDRAAIRELIRTFLEGFGYGVYETSGGLQAVEPARLLNL